MSDLREKLAQLIANTKAHIRADGRTAYVPIGDAYDAADSVIALLQTEQPNSAPSREEIAAAIALTFGITKFHKDETPMVYKAADAVLALREKAPEQALCSTCPPPDKMVSHVQDVIDRLRDMKNRVTGQDVTTVREGEELLDELLHRCGINQAQDAVFSGRFGTVDGLALARARTFTVTLGQILWTQLS